MKCFVFINNCSATGSYLESNSSSMSASVDVSASDARWWRTYLSKALAQLRRPPPRTGPVQRLDELRTTEVQRLIVRDGITIKCSL